MQSVTPEMYLERVRSHLLDCRPSLKPAERNEMADQLAVQIADYVNDALSKAPSPDLEADFEAQILRAKGNLMLAESSAMRELLPMDEEEEAKIGPNGGYLDEIIES